MHRPFLGLGSSCLSHTGLIWGLLHPGLYRGLGLAAHGPFSLAAREPFFGIMCLSYGFGGKSYEGARVRMVGKMLYATLPIFSLMPPCPKNMIDNPERPITSLRYSHNFSLFLVFCALSTHQKNTSTRHTMANRRCHPRRLSVVPFSRRLLRLRQQEHVGRVINGDGGSAVSCNHVYGPPFGLSGAGDLSITITTGQRN